MTKTQVKCPKCGNTGIWNYDPTVGPNENGWACICGEWRPGEPEGFCPDLDVIEFEQKVGCILQFLNLEGMLYVSNSDEGDCLVECAVARLEHWNRRDCYSVIEALYQLQAGHWEYWQKIGDGVRSGEDPRVRCPCGNLSNCSSLNGDGTWSYSCKDCP